MSFSRETQEKINRFAKEQSQNYLQDAEMTYIEKLRQKSGQAKRKIGRKLARFKGQSGQGLEAQNDMTLYMIDYMNDLISQGLSEQEAFDKASEAMKFASDSQQSADLSERFIQYYENHAPATDDVIGLLYGGFSLLGMTLGALTGFLSSGGVPAFLDSGWINTLIGCGIGMFIGTGLSMIAHAIVTAYRRR